MSSKDSNIDCMSKDDHIDATSKDDRIDATSKDDHIDATSKDDRIDATSKDDRIDLICPSLTSNILYAPACKTLQVLKISPYDWSMVQLKFSFLNQTLNLMAGGEHAIFFVPRSKPQELYSVDDRTEIYRYGEEFQESIQGIKVGLSHIVVVLQTSITTCYLKVPPYARPFERMDNLKNMYYLHPNLVSINTQGKEVFMACPISKRKIDHVHLYDVIKRRTLTTFKAHKKGLSCISLNANATLVATASATGRKVKVFNRRGEKLHQFRRSLTKVATIESLIFSPKSHLLACSKNIKKVYIFKLDGTEQKTKTNIVTKMFTEKGFGSRKSTHHHQHTFDDIFATITIPSSWGNATTHGFITNAEGQLGLVISQETNRVQIFEVSEYVGGECNQKAEFQFR